MKAEKDKKTGKWLIQYRYTDWQGKRRKSTKRGFATKREAEEWLRNFLITQKADFDMKFADFWKMYCADMETRLREHTMGTKKYIVELKILPYFGNERVNDITAADIRQWQNELIKMGYSPTYLKTINNQLSAIFNYAIRYYNLKSNMAFMTLYWTGMRLGELLALNPKDVITPPKTPKSKRVITVPEFLAADIKDYMDSLYDLQENDRLFSITKYYLEHEMQRGIKESGVKRTRLRDLRHSHASLLIELGFSPLEIANRLGHEKVETTLNTYAHLYPNKQTKLAERLDSEYKGDL